MSETQRALDLRFIERREGPGRLAVNRVSTQNPAMASVPWLMNPTRADADHGDGCRTKTLGVV
jgi:hypothetical protein